MRDFVLGNGTARLAERHQAFAGTAQSRLSDAVTSLDRDANFERRKRLRQHTGLL